MDNSNEPTFKYLDFFSYFDIDINCLNLNELILDSKLKLNLSTIEKYINYINKYKDDIKNFEKELIKIKYS